MKKIFIVLIGIGVIAGIFYMTRPKKIDLIVVPAPVAVTNVNLQGTSCYEYHHLATPDAPYKVDEYIKLTVAGNTVTGTKKGTQKGPDMTNGYTGTLKGMLDKNTISVLFSYTIEGSKNIEREIYTIIPNGLEKHRYPLIENKTVLEPDTTKEATKLSYAKATCVEDTRSPVVTTGTISGHITIGPFCPVQIEGHPCPVPPEAYSSRKVIVYASDGITIKQKVAIDSNGDYTVSLASGTYFLQVDPAGIGPGDKKKVTIIANKTSTVDFDIDTGMR